MRRADPMPPRAGSDRVSQVQSLRPEVPEAAPEPMPVSAPARVPSSDELAATLERLGGLRDKGLITDAEYEAKKRDILERM